MLPNRKSVIIVSVIVGLCWFPFGPLLPAQAAPISNSTVLLDRINEGVVSKHTITFTNTSGVSGGQTITITYPGSSFVFGGSYSFADMVLEVGSVAACTSGTFSSKTLAGSPSGATWGATYSSNVVTFTSGTDTITANRCVRITLNTNGAGHTLTNPSVGSNTNYKITIATTSDSGSAAVVVLDDPSSPDGDQVQVNASVDYLLAFDVDTVVTNCNNNTETNFANNVINFGTLAPGIAKFSDSSFKFVCIDLTTNSLSGANVFIQSSRANTVGGLVNGTAVIASATANLNLGGTLSGYGVRVSSTGTPASGSFSAVSPFNSGVAGSVGQVPGASTSAANIVSTTAPAQTGASSRIAIEVGAKAATSTGAGRYTDLLTFTVTLNF